MLVLLLSILGAAAYRFRGGGFYHTGRTQLARAVWACFVSGLIYFTTASVIGSLVALIGAFVGLIAIGHSEFQDSNTMPRGYSKDGKSYESLLGLLKVYTTNDFYGNLVVGFVRGSLIFFPLAFLFQTMIYGVLGNMFLYAISYYLAWNALPHSDGRQHFFSNPEGSVHNAEYAELMYGFMFVLMVVCLV